MDGTEDSARAAQRSQGMEKGAGDGDLFDAPRAERPWLPSEVREAEPSYPAVPGLLDGLNEAQRVACLHDQGPLLILAGPGSGKTRVITHRIVHLITARAVAPREILAITFTNKGAGEMRERVERALGTVKGLWISTFHALCARILRRDIEALGYSRDFSIYDTRDRNGLIKKLVKDLGYDAQRFRPAVIGGWISNLKNRYVRDAGELAPDPADGLDDEVYKKVLRGYEKAMRGQNALDFDDLLIKVLELFDAHPGVRDAYSRRFRYVMVDEYQDTNRVQYLLTRHLASHHGNLAVCGDPDQSIYRWRGADIRNILDFEADFPDPVTVRLEQNYRSTGNILAAATAIIRHNSERKDKELWTAGAGGQPLVVLECGDENEEAREIALQCLSLRSGGRRWSEIAVFYRMNFMQRALESALRLAKVPYQVVAGLEFYARREIRDLVAHLRLIVNPADDVAFARVVNAPARGVGETSLKRLAAWAAERGVPLSSACRSEEARAGIRGRGRKGLAEFAALLEVLAPLRDGDPALAIDLLLDEIDAGRWLGEMDDGSGSADREANVEELRAHAAEYERLHPAGGLRGFLQEVALVSEVDDLDEGADAIKLMTLHAAKGLEFPCVFLAGVEDELLPHSRALVDDPDGGEEEERRLFYVGVTRARERLFLSHATVRNFYGAERWQRPSPFLDEIPPELVEGGNDADCAERADRGALDALGAFEPPAGLPDLAVGDRVEHDHFGAGTVELLCGSGVNARAVVTFAHHGSKELLLQYARLKRIG